MSDGTPFLIDASELVDERRGAGWLYRLKNVDGVPTTSLAYDTISPQPYVDTVKMSARACISDATPDRVGDILLPMGCQIDEYRLNPVVYWSHALEPGLSLPIGTSNDENGVLDLSITENEVVATTYFSKSNPIAAQIFELIAEGIVKATSVRETPLKSRQIFRNGRSLTLVEIWSLEEHSWCGLGVNPHSLAKTLDRNRLDGRPIAEPIYKSLTALAPKPSKPGIGLGDLKMADDEKKPEEKPDPATTPADEAQSPSADDTQVAAETEPSDPTAIPFGKQIIDSTHSSVKAICKSLNKCLGPQLEHQAVKSEMGDVNDNLKSMCKSLEGMHATHYPAFKCGLKSDDMDEGGDDMSGGGEADDSGGDSDMKSFLASSTVAQNQLAGIQFRLKGMIDAKNLLPAQKRVLQANIDQMGMILSRAKAYRPTTVAKQPESPTITPEEQSRIDALYAKMTANAS